MSVLRATPDLPFVRRYPPGHEKAGHMVERMGACPDCGEQFRQREVSHDWIAGCHIEFQTGFLGTVSVDESGVHIPPICRKCERDERLRMNGLTVPPR